MGFHKVETFLSENTKEPFGKQNTSYPLRAPGLTYWTCLSPLRKAIDTFWSWWTVSPDGRRRVRCLTRPHCLWQMPSFSILCVDSECLW